MCVFFFSTVLSGQMFCNGAWYVGFSVTQQFTSLDPCLALAFCFSCEQAFCLKLSAEQSRPASWPTVSLHLKQKDEEKLNQRQTELHYSKTVQVSMCLNQSFSNYLIHFVIPEYLTPSLTFIVQISIQNQNNNGDITVILAKLNCELVSFLLFIWMGF